MVELPRAVAVGRNLPALAGLRHSKPRRGGRMSAKAMKTSCCVSATSRVAATECGPWRKPWEKDADRGGSPGRGDRKN